MLLKQKNRQPKSSLFVVNLSERIISGGNKMISAFILNSLLVGAAILIHYEALYRLSNLIPKLSVSHHFRVVIALFGAMCAHVIEIWLFAFGYYFLINFDNFGSLSGNFNNSLTDCSYFSFTTYTSLGYGDIEPLGHIRFLAGLESLVGLVLIGWTASFMYIEMQKFWNKSSS